MPTPSLVPFPASLRPGTGHLRLDPESTLAADEGASAVAALWRTLLAPPSGFEFGEGGEEATLRFSLNERSAIPPEGYRLSVTDERAELVASTLAGLRNGVQTLRQLLPPAALSAGRSARTWELPALEIDDAPRFSWRGCHLDVSRHFMPLTFLFKMVDLLALHKLNVFHLHLNDDQGWRFPSKRYPKLVEVGAWRSQTRIGHQRDASHDAHPYDGTPHGGYYSWDQLRALVAYASDRNVTIVPELDLPGHAQAAIAAYPELGSAGPLEVWPKWGVSEHVLNCSEEAMTFSRAVWDEVLDIFPSPYVHLGGDECPKDEWRRTDAVQERMRQLGIADEEALQGWYTRQLCEHLQQRGRTPIGWDEILEGGPLPKGAAVMSWRGERGGVTAASAGFDVVMCPEQPSYFDHYQSDDPREPLGFGRLNTLDAVYRYEPVPAELDPERAHHVLGTQFQLWSEYLPGPDNVEYMAFPRGAAMAEVAWGTSSGDLSAFVPRLAEHLERLDAMGVNYRPLEGPRPWQQGGTGVRRRFDAYRLPS